MPNRLSSAPSLDVAALVIVKYRDSSPFSSGLPSLSAAGLHEGKHKPISRSSRVMTAGMMSRLCEAVAKNITTCFRDVGRVPLPIRIRISALGVLDPTCPRTLRLVYFFCNVFTRGPSFELCVLVC